MRKKLESNSGVEHIPHSEVESKLRKTSSLKGKVGQRTKVILVTKHNSF